MVRRSRKATSTSVSKNGFSWARTALEQQRFISTAKTQMNTWLKCRLWGEGLCHRPSGQRSQFRQAAGSAKIFGTFGERIDSAFLLIAANSSAVIYGYAGMQLDDESGFYRAGPRNYDPSSGRWLQPDPIWPRAGVAPYRYRRIIRSASSILLDLKNGRQFHFSRKYRHHHRYYCHHCHHQDLSVRNYRNRGKLDLMVRNRLRAGSHTPPPPPYSRVATVTTVAEARARLNIFSCLGERPQGNSGDLKKE